jgi:hypothetical protein
MASLSLRALAVTKSAAGRSPGRRGGPAAIDWENAWISWLRTSLSMYVGEQARRELAVLRLLGDQRRRGLDRELVELARASRRRRGR